MQGSPKLPLLIKSIKALHTPADIRDTVFTINPQKMERPWSKAFQFGLCGDLRLLEMAVESLLLNGRRRGDSTCSCCSPRGPFAGADMGSGPPSGQQWMWEGPLGSLPCKRRGVVYLQCSGSPGRLSGSLLQCRPRGREPLIVAEDIRLDHDTDNAMPQAPAEQELLGTISTRLGDFHVPEDKITLQPEPSSWDCWASPLPSEPCSPH